MEITRSFDIRYKCDNELFGMSSADSLKEAQDSFWDMCKVTGLNYENYYLEEREASKLIQKHLAEQTSKEKEEARKECRESEIVKELRERIQELRDGLLNLIIASHTLKHKQSSFELYLRNKITAGQQCYPGPLRDTDDAYSQILEAFRDHFGRDKA